MAFWEGIFTSKKDCLDMLERYHSFDGQKWIHPPLIASLMLTYACNFQCIYCPFHEMNALVEEKPSREWVKIIEGLASINVRRISFSGGEPLLYPDLYHLIERASALGMSKGVVTNGSKLTREKLEMFANIGLDALTVSIDTLDKDIYSKICNSRNSNLTKILDMILTAKELGKFWTGINTVLTNINVNTIDRLLDFCSLYCIPIQFQAVNVFPNIESLIPAADDLMKAVKIIKERKKDGVLVYNSDDYLDACCEFAITCRFPGNMECLVPFVEMVVTPDLRLKVCCASDEIGDAASPEWEKKWREGESNRWRRLAKSKKCRDCFLIYHEPLRAESQ